MTLPTTRTSPLSTLRAPVPPPHTHQKPAAAFDVPQGYGNIQEHDRIADYHREDVTVAFTVQFVLDASLSSERNGEIWILVVFHKMSKPDE